MESIKEKRCSGCHKLKLFNQFYKDKSKKYGLSSRCIDCHKKYYEVYKKKSGYMERIAKYNKGHRQKRKKWIIMLMGNKCALCGKSYDEICYDFHHTDKTKREFPIGRLLGYSKIRLLKEARKCIMVCANCHRIIHKKERENAYHK